MKTIYQANRDLSSAFGKASNTYPATLYVGLSNNATVTEVGITEPVAMSYARVAVTNETSSFTTATNKSISNANPITFAASTGDWGTVYAVLIYDALSGGNLLYYEALSVSRAVPSGTTLRFSAESITITEV